MKRLCLALLCVCVVTGCASTSKPVVQSPYPALHDELFTSYEAFPVETEEEVFYLSPEAKAFVDRATIISGGSAHHKSVKKLVSAIFDHSEMGLLYRNNANSTADTTFNNRAANCLSLSIMTYAMAQHAGFEAKFYEVDIPEYWTRREGFSFLNGHINLRVGISKDPTVMNIGPSFADVDFDPQMLRNHFPRINVTKKRILAMFYNNKGADALIANSYTRAYSYFDYAQQSYDFALNLNENNLPAGENLAILHRHKGEMDRADEIKVMVDFRRKSNPFYHFILGEQALEEGRYEEALTFYQRALRLDNTRHEVVFGMSKVYYALGDISSAERFLKRAVLLAPNEQDEHRYTSKLSSLANNET